MVGDSGLASLSQTPVSPDPGPFRDPAHPPPGSAARSLRSDSAEFGGLLQSLPRCVAGFPARVYAREGIAQVLFFRAAERCETSYADRSGKYQGQSGITLPRVT